MRGEIAGLRKPRTVDCPAKLREARERLAATQGSIRNSRRSEPSGN